MDGCTEEKARRTVGDRESAEFAARNLLPVPAAEGLRRARTCLIGVQLNARRRVWAGRRAVPVKALPGGVLDARARPVKRAILDVRLAVLVAPDECPAIGCWRGRGQQGDRQAKRNNHLHHRVKQAKRRQASGALASVATVASSAYATWIV